MPGHYGTHSSVVQKGSCSFGTYAVWSVRGPVRVRAPAILRMIAFLPGATELLQPES